MLAYKHRKRLDFLPTLGDIGLSDFLYPTLFAVGVVGLVW